MGKLREAWEKISAKVHHRRRDRRRKKKLSEDEKWDRYEEQMEQEAAEAEGNLT